ncbi:hypothetical protein ACHAAC_10075 [Aeromicrobium sp. CF4.19]|uniref:hypothetical protein n=1 Tax=Aeromicrobium sp. CF4.19 TaxID=3373082 RepID=UPI003EE7F8F9
MTNFDSSRPHPSEPRRAALGLPLVAIIGLSLLALPRVVLHDLDLVSGGSLLNALLVFLPPLIWIAVVVWRRAANPFLTLLTIGVCYGVLLAATHQLLWNVSLGDDPPRLGGNLTDLSPQLQSVILRFFAAVSSLFTGVMVGAVSGLIAWGLTAVTRRTREVR